MPGLEVDPAAPPQEQFIALRDKIFRDTGLDLSRYKENYLKRRIAARMRSLGVDTYAAYAQRLDPAEYNRLIDRITVNVTEFFRDPDVYEELGKLLAALVARKESQPPALVAWSAGCASGEEPYTLAMLLERLRQRAAAFEYSILATDLDESCLARATRGVYPAAAAQKLDPWYREHCLEPQGSELQVREGLRRRVRFERHNLFADPPPTGLDLVLCRNVMIYFSKIQQQRLLDSFHKSLRRGGYFVLGKTETILGPARQFYACVSAGARIFQRL